MRGLLILALCFPSMVLSEEKAEMLELVGRIGGRSALLVLNATQREDAGWLLSGEYVLLPTLVRRFVQGERGPELGVTTLKEGTTPILFGREPVGELRGIWHEGLFRGTRYGPGGQERERFQFSEEFPPMDAYSARVRCDSLDYDIEQGQVKRFEWRSAGCTLSGLQQRPMKGGVRLVAGGCSVTLREVGDQVKVAAQQCSEQCGAPGAPEPLLVDGPGSCRLLRPQARP